jgi:hypothetical protein
MGLPQIPFKTTQTKFVAHTFLEAFKVMLEIGITSNFLQQGF